MSAWAWVPFIAALLAPSLGPGVARALPPPAAVRLATTIALIIAAMTGLVLAIAAELAVTQLQVIAGAKTTPGIARPSVVGLLVGVVSAVVVAFLFVAAVRSLLTSVRELARASRQVRQLGGTHAGLVIVQDETPSAFAVTGHPGRVVVSTAMLRALTSRERQALLAHENAHLRHHHQIYVQLAALAAAANPLLRPLAATVRRNTERWADESAAQEVGDRGLAARAVARAALANNDHSGAVLPPGGRHTADKPSGESQLAHRINRLLEPPPRPAASLVALVLAAAIGCLAAGGTAALSGHERVERVELAVAAAAHHR